MPLFPGTHLGPYEITGLLGSGGMGEVYRARDTRLERTVAIKILPAHLSPDPVRKQRFERSEEHTSELQSPCNLVCRLLLEKKKKKTRRKILAIKAGIMWDEFGVGMGAPQLGISQSSLVYSIVQYSTLIDMIRAELEWSGDS